MLDVDVSRDHHAVLVVDRVVPDDHGSVLVVNHGPSAGRLRVPAVADQRRARRFQATARRIDRVVIELHGNVVTCTAVGQRVRRPFLSPIPLAVGLGLRELGVPLRLTGMTA